MKTQTRLLFRIAAYGLALGVLALFRSGVDYFVTERDVRSSARGPWSAHFRSNVVNHCENSIMSFRRADRSPAAATRFKGYCECLAGGIERAKLISPYFNPVKTNERSHLRASAETVNRFLASTEGQTLTRECAKGQTP